MEGSSNSIDSWRIQPDIPSASDHRIDSRSMSVNRKQAAGIKKKIPLLPQHKSSSVISARRPENRRAAFTLEEAIEYEQRHGRVVDPNMDTKRLRRTISNRQSALRSRMKRSQHVKDMEKMAKDLEDKILVLTPQIEMYKEQQKQLLQENDSLHKLVETRSSEARSSEMLLEQKQLEICSLKETLDSKISREPNSAPDLMQVDLRLNQLTSHPWAYSIEFYQNALRSFESNHFSHDLTFGFQQPAALITEQQPLEVEEDEDIDQYLNFDELS